MNDIQRWNQLLIIGACLLFASCTSNVRKPPEAPITPFGQADVPAKPEGPEKAEPVWRATLSMEACPVPVVNAKQQVEAGLLAGVFDSILGFGIDTALSAFFQSIKDAAKRDRDGVSFDMIYNSRYYQANRQVQAAPWKIRRAQCILIARGIPEAEVKPWCPSSTTAEASKACKDEELVRLAASDLGLSSPSFFAQIALITPVAGGAVIGDLSYVWYPTKLTERSGRARDLFIAAALRKPNPEPGKGEVYAGFSFALKGLVPGEVVPRTLAARWQLPFGGAPPAVPSKETLALIGEETSVGFGHLNLDVSVRESGDVNKFLQAVAKILEKTDVEKQIGSAVKTAVVPGLRDAAQAAQESAAATAAAALSAKVIALCTARSDYYAALATPPVKPATASSLEARTARLDLLWLKWRTAANDIPSNEGVGLDGTACRPPDVRPH